MLSDFCLLTFFRGSRPRRLARPRTSPFHGGNAGSNPAGDAIQFKRVTSASVDSVETDRSLLTSAQLWLVSLPLSTRPKPVARDKDDFGPGLDSRGRSSVCTQPFPLTRNARLETPSPGTGAFLVCWDLSLGKHVCQEAKGCVLIPPENSTPLQHEKRRGSSGGALKECRRLVGASPLPCAFPITQKCTHRAVSACLAAVWVNQPYGARGETKAALDSFLRCCNRAVDSQDLKANRFHFPLGTGFPFCSHIHLSLQHRDWTLAILCASNSACPPSR